jgi:hypothetical protein
MIQWHIDIISTLACNCLNYATVLIEFLMHILLGLTCPHVCSQLQATHIHDEDLGTLQSQKTDISLFTAPSF